MATASTIFTAPADIGQTVCAQVHGRIFAGVIIDTTDFATQRHYGLRPLDEEGAPTDDDLVWVTPGQLRLQPWGLSRGPGALRVHTHRVVDREGAFIIASDFRDCERLTRSYADRGARVEANIPVWYNDHSNPDFYKGPETVGFLHGHP